MGSIYRTAAFLQHSIEHSIDYADTLYLLTKCLKFAKHKFNSNLGLNLPLIFVAYSVKFFVGARAGILR
jgi:hypothetical protein